MNVKITEVLEEVTLNKLISCGWNHYIDIQYGIHIFFIFGVQWQEWSYIPVGVSIPDTTQQHLGFGAAASMVHPATGKDKW